MLYLAHHELVGDNAHCEVVHRDPVTVPAYHLRRYETHQEHAVPMYPGVPLVSCELSGFHRRAAPRSVMRT